MKRTLALAALLALGSAGFVPAPAMAQPNVSVYIGGPPPPPRYERVPVARRGHVWSQGHWEWNGRRHYWVPGVWLVERPGYAYSAPVWYQDNGRWQMRQGGWARGGRDRDRDGIPDRFERPRHDRDRHDGPRYDGPRHNGDRDHDGVPNRFDRAPDNPRRD
jgi:hypothetical protein